MSYAHMLVGFGQKTVCKFINFAKYRRYGDNSSWSFAGSSGETKEVLRLETQTEEFWGVWESDVESLTLEGDYLIWETRKIRTPIHWSTYCTGAYWQSCLHIGVTTRVGGDSWCVLCVLLEKMTSRGANILPIDELRVDESKRLVEEPKAILERETM